MAERTDKEQAPLLLMRGLTPALLLTLIVQVWIASSSLETRLTRMEARIEAFSLQQIRNVSNIEIIRDTQQQRGPRIEALEKFAERYREAHYDREAKNGK